MVQTVLLFLLGFFTAALLAIAVAPAIWRQAGQLTRKQMEAALPLSINEVQADKDQQRAEFAVTLRKMEIKSKSLQEKLSGQMAETGIYREKLRTLEKERDVLQAELSSRSDQLEELNTNFIARKQELAKLGVVRENLDNQIIAMETEITKRDNLISELKIDADNGRIEIVAKMTEQDQLNSRLRDLNLTRKSLEEKLKLSGQEVRVLQENARKEAKRIAELSRQNERLISQLSDREERMERRENELARMKITIKSSSEELNAAKRQLFTVSQRVQQFERENAQLVFKAGKIQDGRGIELAETAMKKLEEDKARLSAAVAKLTLEKDELVKKLSVASSQGIGQENDDAKLRSQMHDLTAKVVALTADGEGALSPIPRLLQKTNVSPAQQAANPQQASDPQFELPVSLADRVKALQKSVQSG